MHSNDSKQDELLGLIHHSEEKTGNTFPVEDAHPLKTDLNTRRFLPFYIDAIKRRDFDRFNSEHTHSHFYYDFVRWFERKYIAQNTTPSHSPKKLRHILIINNLLFDPDFLRQKIWPAVMWLIPNSYLAAVLSTSIPLLARFKQLYHRWNWNQALDNEQTLTLTHTLHYDGNLWTDGWTWLWPQANRPYALARAEFALCWDARTETSVHDALLNVIDNLAKNHRYLAQLYALRTLGNFSDRVNNRSLYLKQIRARAEKDGFYSLPGIYAHYLLWSLGEKDIKKFQAFFWVLSLYATYTSLSYFAFITKKFIEFSKYLLAKYNCEKSKKIYLYFSALAEYACTVCGDWEFVYLKNRYTSQGCLDGLLSQPRSPEMILQKLKSLILHPDFTTIDLSHQAWTNWTEVQWEEFLTQLETAPLTLTLFNLSTVIPNSFILEDNKIPLLTHFLNKIPTKKLDLRNQRIGPNMLNEFISQLNPFNYYLEFIDLSSAALTDVGIITLSAWLWKNAIKHLALSNNLITNYGLAQLGNTLKNNTKVTFLDISQNQFDDTGIISFSNSISSMALRTLDLSFNSITADSLTRLGLAITLSNLTSLVMVSCNLGDLEISTLSPYFTASAIDTIDFSYNAIRDQGIANLLKNLQGSNVSHLYIGNNFITDTGISIAATLLPGTRIKLFHAPSNSFSSYGFSRLIQILSNTTIEFLNVAGNYLGDASATLLATALANATVLLGIDFSDNSLTDIGGLSLVNLLKTTSIRWLSIMNNLITRMTLYGFSNVTTQLTYLDISGNRIDSSGATALAKHLPFSLLNQLHLNNNPIGDIGGIAIAHTESQSQLISLELNNCELGNNAGRLLCNALTNTHIAFENFELANNPIDPREVDITSCYVSSASRSIPSTNLILHMIPAVILLYALYHILSPVVHCAKNYAQRFLDTPRLFSSSIATVQSHPSSALRAPSPTRGEGSF